VWLRPFASFSSSACPNTLWTSQILRETLVNRKIIYLLCQILNELVAALLLAYIKGKANLCRTLVKSACCVGTMNKEGITIFNYQTPTKQLLSK